MSKFFVIFNVRIRGHKDGRWDGKYTKNNNAAAIKSLLFRDRIWPLVLWTGVIIQTIF